MQGISLAFYLLKIVKIVLTNTRKYDKIKKSINRYK